MVKLVRNDLCPCGSGKKYKQCCLNMDEIRHKTDRSETIPKALEWLEAKHGLAVHQAIDAQFFGGIDANQYQLLHGLEEDVVDSIIGNAMEWLLADGSITHKGKEHRVAELLLGKGGPSFSEAQRRWFELMSITPLRLYEVIEVKPEEFLTLRDAMLPESLSIRVEERTGSEFLTLDEMLAARILPIENHFELSGAAYVFPQTVCGDLLVELRHELEGLEPDSSLAKEITSTLIPYYWLQLFITPFEMPSLVDQVTGQPLLFVTDHYRVQEWAALERRLLAEAAIEGSHEQGWRCTLTGEDGRIRTRLNIDVGKRRDRIKVSYVTQNFADDGRPWFETVAGASIDFLCRDISDPQGMISHSQRNEAKKIYASTVLSSESVSEIVIQGIQEMYVDWADEPLPYLNDKTPREVIQTPEGLEQVKYLLHAYEHSDPEQANAQHRDPVLFAFLWQSLGIIP